MTYRSTRGGPQVTFEEALLAGLAPNGGLYVPDRIPPVDYDASFSAGSFAEMGARVLSAWIGDEIHPDSLASIVSDALDFPVPVVALDGWDGVYVLELFHGPTLSFKDFGARTMARWMGYFLRGQQERLTILVATSGDTGSAVADGFAGQDRIEVVLLYPKGKVSPVQERQLIASRPGVRALAVDGDFDDCQRMVKEAFVDEQLIDLHLSSANSINIGRLLPQTLYYAWAIRDFADEVVFCVPSGNLGNLTAGVLAHLSGLPAGGFIAAHNENDFFPRFLSGEDGAAFSATKRTLSNAMDVGAPSNFERLSSLLTRDRMRSLIRGTSVTDEETLASMRRVHDETGYVADPHTAVGLEGVRRLRDRSKPVVVLATAHPSKFPETVRQALGFEAETPKRLAELWERDVSVEEVVPTLDALRDVLLQRA